MQWFALPLGLVSDPKIPSDQAFRSLMRLWDYCGTYETDGIVPEDEVQLRATPAVVDQLAEAGLIALLDGRVQVSGFLSVNIPHEHREAAREKARLRMRKLRDSRCSPEQHPERSGEPYSRQETDTEKTGDGEDGTDVPSAASGRKRPTPPSKKKTAEERLADEEIRQFKLDWLKTWCHHANLEHDGTFASMRQHHRWAAAENALLRQDYNRVGLDALRDRARRFFSGHPEFLWSRDEMPRFRDFHAQLDRLVRNRNGPAKRAQADAMGELARKLREGG